MKNLIPHYLLTNEEEVLKNSYMNCHVKGLHSIMLSKTPEKTIRLYIAVPGNGMIDTAPMPDMPLAFHPHSYDITLDVIKGAMTNWVVKECDELDMKDISSLDNLPMKFDKWHYRSRLRDGKQSFIKYPKIAIMKTVEKMTFLAGEAVHMGAKVIHSVSVPQDRFTAWMVYESKVDDTYENVCYSNANLNDVNTEGMYLPMTMRKIKELIDQVI